MEKWVTESYAIKLSEELKQLLAENKRLKEYNVLLEESKYDSNTFIIYLWGNGGWKHEGSTSTMAKFEFKIEVNLKGQYLYMHIPEYGYVSYKEMRTANQIMSDYIAKKKHELFYR